LKNIDVISITGGTGHLGINLIKSFLNKGHHIKALIRHTSYPFVHPRLTWIIGDLNDLNALSNLTENSQVLIHAASAISMGELDRDLVYEVNVKGTQNIVNICLEQSIRFIYISSSTAVIDPLDAEEFDENRPYREDKSFYYAWTKAQAEKYILEKIEHTKLDAFIIRPTAIIGPEDPVPSRFGRTILDLHRGALPFITDGGYNMVDVRDLTETIFNSIASGKRGAIYLTGGQFISLKALAKMIRPTKIPMILPLNFLLNILPIINVYDRWFKLKWPVSKESLNTLKLAPKNMNCSKAIQELDHSNRAINESIKDLITWFEK